MSDRGEEKRRVESAPRLYIYPIYLRNPQIRRSWVSSRGNVEPGINSVKWPFAPIGQCRNAYLFRRISKLEKRRRRRHEPCLHSVGVIICVSTHICRLCTQIGTHPLPPDLHCFVQVIQPRVLPHQLWFVRVQKHFIVKLPQQPDGLPSGTP